MPTEKSIRIIEQMKRMGASETDQIYYIDMLKQFGQEDIAKMLWNKFFAQNIDQSDIFKFLFSEESSCRKSLFTPWNQLFHWGFYS
jgi:hypothetical protein